MAVWHSGEKDVQVVGDHAEDVVYEISTEGGGSDGYSEHSDAVCNSAGM